MYVYGRRNNIGRCGFYILSFFSSPILSGRSAKFTLRPSLAFSIGMQR